MSLRERFLLPAALLAVTVTANVLADKAGSDVAKPATPSVSAEKVAGWVKDLDSDDFAARKAATKQLAAAGRAAIESVERAARTDDLEKGARCISILQKLYESDDAETKQAAAAALKRLAESEHRSVAQRAAKVIEEPEPANQPRNPFGNVRIQVQVGGAAGRVLPAGRGNLQRSIKVEENGKTIEIDERIGREIVVKITEKVEGQEKTTEYKATNAVDLRKKHPAAFALYRKHIGKARLQRNAAAAAIQVRNGNVKIEETNVNGQRRIEVDDNGKKIEITEKDGKEITVEVTEEVDGKEKTEKYAAKNLEELKKQHPKGAEIYEKYATQQNGVRIFGGVNGIRLQALPANGQALPIRILPARPAPRNTDREELKRQADEVRKGLDAALERSKQLSESESVDTADVKRLAEEIARAVRELEKLQQSLAE